jgi:antitoxin YefM
MKTATLTEFRSNMKERLKEIEDDQDILILSGSKKRDFVVLTLETFNAMEETAHLLSTAANTERLMESIAQDRNGNVVARELKLNESRPVRKRIAPKKHSSIKRKSK